MTICSAGTRLGPYEIISPLGAGGMGEVWKARDTRLARIVAVKFSAARFSQRFEREARAIAALNHSHICTLYDVGPDYLVMEYVEGAPLGGPLPLDKAIENAKQILDALDAAHRRGIVHRDLKPANILLTKSGIKLLDFGLARSDPPVAAGSETIASVVRQEGTIAGTLQYMAPEQLQGGQADARADIFAFGCVLYEMLTGKRAFEGKSAASIIVAVLEREAPSISAVAPAYLEGVLKKCLAKDPDERWQSARDLRTALELSPSGISASTETPRRRQRSLWIAIAACIALAAIALGLALRLWHAPAANSAIVRFQVYPPEGAVFSGPTHSTVGEQQFTVSPNGRAVAFVATRPGSLPMLWVRGFDELEARPLPGTENADYPFWSPDGGWLAFVSEGRLKKIRAAGGPVQAITEDAPDLPDLRGGTWGSDGVILVGTATSSLFRVPVGGGVPAQATHLDRAAREGSHRWPYFLPDGRHFLFTVRSEAAAHRGIYVGSLDSETTTRLIHLDTNAAYASPLSSQGNGYLLFAEGNTLLGQAFNPERLQLNGQPFTVAGDIGRSSQGYGAFSVSPAGVLAQGGIDFESGRLTWFDRDGSSLGSIGPEGYYADFRLSPDEKRLAVSLVDPRSGYPDLWMSDAIRNNNFFRFTTGPGSNTTPLWSPDGARIVFRTTRRGGALEFYEKSSAGAGEEKPLLPNATPAVTNLYDLDWSRDGRYILYSTTPGSGTELWIFSLQDHSSTRLMRGAQGSFSPDGKLLAYVSDESGKREVYVQTFPLSDRKWHVSTGSGSDPRWKGDGREMYYPSEDRKLMAATVSPGLSFGMPKLLFQTEAVTGNRFRMRYLPSRDGRRFLINTRTGDSAPKPITIELNWIAGLSR